jgi:hypothetical protein
VRNRDVSCRSVLQVFFVLNVTVNLIFKIQTCSNLNKMAESPAHVGERRSCKTSGPPTTAQAEERAAEQKKLWQEFTSAFDKALIDEKALTDVKSEQLWQKLCGPDTYPQKLYNKWSTFVLASFQTERKEAQIQCKLQQPLDNAVLRVIVYAQRDLNNSICCQTSVKYLNRVCNQLHSLCDDGIMSAAVVMYANVLLQRLQATFPGGYAQMQDWFFAGGISEISKNVANKYGVLCIMFAMCAQLAFCQLQDEYVKNSKFATIVFWSEDPLTTKTLHRDFVLLQSATLKQLEWKVYVSVADYAHGVMELKGLTRKKKDEILNMFADKHALFDVDPMFGVP